MAGINNRAGKYPKLTTEELEIIGCFATGQRSNVSSQTLRLESTETSIRLISNNGKLIGISKQTNKWQRKVLINHNSSYTSSIVELLTDRGFIKKQKSSHPDFTEHHYYEVPHGYKLNHTDILQLWKIWWNNKRYQLNAHNLPIDILVFSKGNWCPVQDLQPKQGNFVVKTDRGELKVLAEDLVVWIDQADPQTTSTKSSPLAVKQTPSPAVQASPSEINIPTEVIPISDSPIMQFSPPVNAHTSDRTQQVELPEQEEDLDLESYLSTFNTEDTEDIDRIEGIYNISELLNETVGIGEKTPPPAPPKPSFKLEATIVERPADRGATVQPRITATIVSPASPEKSDKPMVESSTPIVTPTTNQPAPISISERKQLLKLKAVNTLNQYLKQGDLVTQTEVLKNGRGQVINSQINTTRRGCPGWTIEQIKQLEDELAKM